MQLSMRQIMEAESGGRAMCWSQLLRTPARRSCGRARWLWPGRGLTVTDFERRQLEKLIAEPKNDLPARYSAGDVS